MCVWASPVLDLSLALTRNLTIRSQNSDRLRTFCLLLGYDTFEPQQYIQNVLLSPIVTHTFLSSPVSVLTAKMPITNGDANGNSAPLLRGRQRLDHTKALEILEHEYPERDGLDIQTLLDSTKNGALTYNDFLVLPGYIGTNHFAC